MSAGDGMPVIERECVAHGCQMPARRSLSELLEAADAEIYRLREALSYYADPINWKGEHSGNTPAHRDAGAHARRMLNAR